MALSEVRRRLRKYQRETRQAREITPVVAEIVRAGRYYDELTIPEQDEVIAYYGTDRDTFETVHGGIFNNYSLHFQVEKRKTVPRTKAELEKAQAEIRAIFDEIAAEYNSPEAEAQRKAEYEELQRLGELRRMDCLCGRDMDKCHPLPWAEQDREARERRERFDRERRERYEAGRKAITA